MVCGVLGVLTASNERYGAFLGHFVGLYVFYNVKWIRFERLSLEICCEFRILEFIKASGMASELR